MTAAIALAIVLVIAVAGASMAMESQRTAQPAGRRPVRPVTRPNRATDRERARRAGRTKEKAKAPEPAESEPTPTSAMPTAQPEFKGPELLRTGVSAEARVVSVVDERTIGPVTRSRLVLRIQPSGSDPVEVTVRHAFPTPESRGQVKVGGPLPVRYDADDPRRVVVDLPQE